MKKEKRYLRAVSAYSGHSLRGSCHGAVKRIRFEKLESRKSETYRIMTGRRCGDLGGLGLSRRLAFRTRESAYDARDLNDGDLS